MLSEEQEETLIIGLIGAAVVVGLICIIKWCCC